MKTTACPMDCFDACEIIYNEGTCKPNKIHPITQGTLCKPFAYLLKEQNIKDKVSSFTTLYHSKSNILKLTW